MRKLKKWSCLLLALLMLPALAACGKKQQPDSDASQNEVQDTDTPQDSTPTEEQTKVLVVYFSATGSTKAVAGYIAETLGADTFELTPQEPYLAADLDYNNSESRVCREHENVSLQMWLSPPPPWSTGSNTARCLWAIPSGGAAAHGLSTDL